VRFPLFFAFIGIIVIALHNVEKGGKTVKIEPPIFEVGSLGYRPHDGQIPFHKSDARFRLIVAGTRGGKTTAGSWELASAAINGKKGDLNWVVAPTYPMLEVDQRAVLAWFEGVWEVVADWRRKERRLVLRNETAIEFKSADWPDGLRAAGVKNIWGDEASYFKEEAHRVLRTRVSDTGGRIWYTTTPKGQKSWVYRFYKRCQDRRVKSHAAFHFPTEFNPAVPRSEVEEARRDLPDSFFRQEYLGEFLEDGASVFGKIRSCLCRFDRNGGTFFVVGCDPARRQDFSVSVVLNEKRQTVEMLRMHNEPWPVQRKRIAELARKWNAPVILDTSASDPLSDDLKTEGIEIVPYPFSLQSKEALFRSLQIGIEAGEISIHQDYEIIAEEAERIEYGKSSRGVTRYETPPGFHDDCITALALANWGAMKHIAVRPPILVDSTEDQEKAARVLDLVGSNIPRRWNFKEALRPGRGMLVG
jgi:hypothetical protein